MSWVMRIIYKLFYNKNYVVELNGKEQVEMANDFLMNNLVWFDWAIVDVNKVELYMTTNKKTIRKFIKMMAKQN